MPIAKLGDVDLYYEIEGEHGPWVDSGHNAHVERTAEYNVALLAFLEAHHSGPAAAPIYARVS